MAGVVSESSTSTTDKLLSTQNVSYQKRILVTGGAGFIGSHVVERLVKTYPEYFIINLDKLESCASLQNLRCIEGYPNYKFIKGNICDEGFLRELFTKEDIYAVIHLAGHSHVDNSFCSSLEFSHVNVHGTHVLVNTAYKAGVKLFLQVSTDEVYGGNGEKPMSEDAKLQPTNPYAASKAAAEHMVMSYWRSFKFPVIICRPNNVYGPRQYPEKVIPKFISLLERERKCCIHGDGSSVRHFIYATDVAAAIEILLHKGTPGEVYNIGGDHAASILELARCLISKVKGTISEKAVTQYIQYTADRPLNDKKYPIDSYKLKVLGWHPKVTWEEGIINTVKWYKRKENFQSWSSAEEVLSPFPNERQTTTTNQSIGVNGCIETE